MQAIAAATFRAFSAPPPTPPAETEPSSAASTPRSTAPEYLEFEARALERRRLLFGGKGKRSILPDKSFKKDPRLLQLSQYELEQEEQKKKRAKSASDAGAASSDAADAEQQQQQADQPRWERLQSGMKLRVWWEGCEEWFECTLLGFRVGYNASQEVVYTHRCQYDSGIMEHDLSKTEFEVCEDEDREYALLDRDGLSVDGPKAGVAVEHGPPAAIARIQVETPRRRWLAQQEEKAVAAAEEDPELLALEQLEQSQLQTERQQRLSGASELGVAVNPNSNGGGAVAAAAASVVEEEGETAEERGKSTIKRIRNKGGIVGNSHTPLKGRTLSLVNTDKEELRSYRI